MRKSSKSTSEKKDKRKNPRDLTQKSEMAERKALISERVHLYKNALRIPPSINQFNTVLDTEDMNSVLNLFLRYRPENWIEKKQRLAQDNPRAGPKPILTKFGLKHVTDLIEQKKAKLVLIAGDVDPIEVVMFLPTLCRKMGVPYAIVKGKTELGPLVNLKQTACVCLCDVSVKDSVEFKNIVEKANSIFLNNYETTMRTWGGGVLLRDKVKESE